MKTYRIRDLIGGEYFNILTDGQDGTKEEFLVETPVIPAEVMARGGNFMVNPTSEYKILQIAEQATCSVEIIDQGYDKKEDGQIVDMKITTNGTYEIEPTLNYNSLRQINIESEVWEGLDFTQIGYSHYDMVDTNEMLQQALEYSRQAKEQWPTEPFAGNKRLIFCPYVDTSNVTDMNEMFSDCFALTTVPLLDTSNVTNMNAMFTGCSALTMIPLLDTSNVTNMNEMFSTCSALTTLGGFKNVKTSFNLSNSPLLTHESLMNVINNLYDLTSLTTKTLALGSTNLSKLTDEEKAIATGKNWILA